MDLPNAEDPAFSCHAPDPTGAAATGGNFLA